MSKIKFAVIGQGHIGKRHAEMIRRNAQCKLVAVCDALPKEAIGLENLQEKFYSNIDELLKQHPDIEVVNVCTPNGLHAEHALKALEAGKHVVVEKPMALTKLDCEKVIYAALHHHKTVFCVMQNRYSPPSVWLKDVIDNKILGDIYMVQLNCYWNRDERYYKKGSWKGTNDLDGGTLFTQFSHWVDIMYWLFGDIKNIQAKFADFNHKDSTDFEDSGFVSFDFVNGGMGSIKVGGQYMDVVETCNIKDYTMPKLGETNPANDYGAYKGSANNHNFVIENVINTLTGKNKITTNALEGLKVVDIIERIYALRPENVLKKQPINTL